MTVLEIELPGTGTAKYTRADSNQSLAVGWGSGQAVYSLTQD